MLRAGRRLIAVYESTADPGVTEDLCGHELRRISGLTRSEDFVFDYSPERVDPGECEHTVDRITKVVSDQTSDALDAVAERYGQSRRPLRAINHVTYI